MKVHTLSKFALITAVVMGTPTLALSLSDQPDDQAVTPSTTSISASTGTYSTQGASGKYDASASTPTDKREGTHGVSGTGVNGPTGPADTY